MPFSEIDDYLNAMRRSGATRHGSLSRILKDPLLLRSYREKYPEENVDLLPYFLCVVEHIEALGVEIVGESYTFFIDEFLTDFFLDNDTEKKYCETTNIQTEKEAIPDLFSARSHEFNLLLLESLRTIKDWQTRLVIVELLGQRGQFGDEIFIFDSLNAIYKKEKRSIRVKERLLVQLINIIKTVRARACLKEYPEIEAISDTLNMRLLEYWIENSQIGRTARDLLRDTYPSALSDQLIRKIIDLVLDTPQKSPTYQLTFETALGILSYYIIRERAYHILAEYLEIETRQTRINKIRKLKIFVNPNRPTV